MTVNIIICTRDRADSLRETLASLQTVDVPAGIHPEILVVDNGSTDSTAAVVRQFPPGQIPVRCLSEPTPGQTCARNAGLASSAGEIVIFTDDDLRFPKPWLQSLCDPIVDKKCHAVAGAVDLAPQLLRPWMTPTHRAWLASSERLDARAPGEMVGANMAFARSVLDVVPAFDPELGPGRLGYADDTLFAFQLKKAGLKIFHSGGAAVLHCFGPSRLSRESWLRAAKAYGRSNGYLDYHWRHITVSPRPLRVLRAFFNYAAPRVLKAAQCASLEGAPEWELWNLAQLHRVLQYSVESARPRNYDREGLVKIRGLLAPQSRSRPACATP